MTAGSEMSAINDLIRATDRELSPESFMNDQNKILEGD
jgi:hypothetical protein